MIYNGINIIMIFYQYLFAGYALRPVSLFTQFLLIILSKCQMYFVVLRGRHNGMEFFLKEHSHSNQNWITAPSEKISLSFGTFTYRIQVSIIIAVKIDLHKRNCPELKSLIANENWWIGLPNSDQAWGFPCFRIFVIGTQF